MQGAAPPSWGALTVTIVGAEYDGRYIEGSPNSYCALWLLEKVKWRRRKSRKCGGGPGEEPLNPQWGDEFVFEDVRDDSKVAIDVWNVRGGGKTDEFLGKATIVLADAIASPVEAWHEILPGRVQVALTWEPYDGGAPTALTLPAAAADKPTGAPSPPPSRATRAAIDAQPSPDSPGPRGMKEPDLSAMLRPGLLGNAPNIKAPTPPKPASPPKPMPPPQAESPLPNAQAPSASHASALAQLEAQAVAYEEDDDFESDVNSDAGGSTPAPPRASPPPPVDYFEYTHRGGSGNGGKENQDAYFLLRLDDANAVFGVMDGHGHDHGKIAAWAAAEAVKDYLGREFDRLRTDPEDAMTEVRMPYVPTRHVSLPRPPPAPPLPLRSAVSFKHRMPAACAVRAWWQARLATLFTSLAPL